MQNSPSAFANTPDESFQSPSTTQPAKEGELNAMGTAVGKKTSENPGTAQVPTAVERSTTDTGSTSGSGLANTVQGIKDALTTSSK
ncbi:hypothetical protein M427DRAFT_34208 [Gonapodya prolifera JEL478]|uniref:Uncharacterized protein n=1 Tax=Gonapodya prolifera (strain JEL478) TaxID=1344416 RepID=A0A139A902_GONPJ|nr:hypothetical protein M427DRAFT_34208 [Gonapodya prolifera JEL478]|eukprot:KXS13159.1 hypothetical protein M427DRAFT_34208 [Gonapodya prolifera JEL478]